MKFDMHVHTISSPDSHASLLEMINGARAAGLDFVCFTDRVRGDAAVEHLRALTAVKAFDTGVQVLAGLEVELSVEGAQDLAYVMERVPEMVDFVAAVPPDATAFWRRAHFQGYGVNQIYDLWYDRAEAAIHSFGDDLDVVTGLSHLAVADPTGRHTDEQQLASVERLLDAMIEKHVGLEARSLSMINAAGTVEYLMKSYRDRGGRIATIGSGATQPEDVGRGFGEAEALLGYLGYPVVDIFVERAPVQAVMF